MMDTDGRKELAIEIVHSAGSVLRENFGLNQGARTKPSTEWVSEADLTANKTILDAIISAYPDDAILSEESPKQEGSSGFRWIVDPLDGSHNFLTGSHDFSCGLAIEADGELIINACYLPMYDQLFWVKKSEGAFCNGERIRVSGEKTIRGRIAFVDSNLKNSAWKMLEDIRRLASVGCSIRLGGCSHLAFMRVAQGAAIATISRPGKEWDISPGVLMVKEAGGMVTDEDGNEWKPGASLIATNGLIHSSIQELIGRNSD